MKNWRFNMSLRRRGLTLQKLAQSIGHKQHGHVCEVVNNKPGHGGSTTRQKLFAHLTAEEIKALGWTREFNAWRREQKKGGSTGNNVPMLSGGVR